jgi:predicted nucleic acid-binding protein
MASKLSVLIDLNVILDVLQKREPYFKASAGILAIAETGQVHASVAAHSITTLFYLIQKDKSAAEAKATLTNLLQFIDIATVDQNTIEQALNLEYRDFEDAVQMISAVQSKVNFLITRNVKDYQPALLPVMQPVDFLGTLKIEC